LPKEAQTAKKWTATQQDLFEGSPPGAPLAPTERAKALEQLQAPLIEVTLTGVSPLSHLLPDAVQLRRGSVQLAPEPGPALGSLGLLLAGVRAHVAASA
jgi:hypothetical protein